MHNLPFPVRLPGLTTSWIVLDGGDGLPYRPEDIVCHAMAESGSSPPEFLDILREVEQDEVDGRARGEHASGNGGTFELTGWQSGRDGVAERRMLELRFRPGTRYRHRAARRLFQRSERHRRWLTEWSPRTDPHPLLCADLGIHLIPVTTDERVVLARRGPGDERRHGRWGSGVASRLERPGDGDADGVPRLARAAVRAVEEELGFTVDSDDIRFLSFGVDPSAGHYGLVGCVDLPVSAEELLCVLSLGGKDPAENDCVALLPPDAATIAAFVHENPRWVPAGITALLHTFAHVGGSVLPVVQGLSMLRASGEVGEMEPRL